jgi:hypothetical protein
MSEIFLIPLWFSPGSLKRKRNQIHEVCYGPHVLHTLTLSYPGSSVFAGVFLSRFQGHWRWHYCQHVAATFNPDDRVRALLSKLIGKWMRVPVPQLSFASCNTYKFPAVLINIPALVHSPSRRLLSLSPPLSPSVCQPNSTALHSTIALHLARNFFALFGLTAALISDSSASFISTVPPQLHSWLFFHYPGYTDLKSLLF